MNIMKAGNENNKTASFDIGMQSYLREREKLVKRVSHRLRRIPQNLI